MGMKISYKELNEDLAAVLEARKKDPLERYSVDIEGEMKNPTAMKVLSVIENTSTFEQRAQFVKELLQGCKVSIWKDGKKSFDIGITQGVEWWAIEDFNKDPMALRYLVTAIYTKFLKKYEA